MPGAADQIHASHGFAVSGLFSGVLNPGGDQRLACRATNISLRWSFSLRLSPRVLAYSHAPRRVVAPLARANSEHADQLVKALSVAPMSTRELRSWFEHYQKASRIARQRLVSHPRLFLAALEESIEQCMSERLRDGPEGGCEIDLRRINVLIRSIGKRLPDLRPLSEELVTTVSLVQRNFEALCQDIKRYIDHDPLGDPRQRARSQGARLQPARDQPPAEAVA